MTLNVYSIVVIYFLIGLFIAGFYMAFDNDISAFLLILFFWPIALLMAIFIVAVVIPVVLGKWIGSRIKEWF